MTTTSDPYWTIAAEVCTPKQLQVLELKRRHNLSLQQIALATDRSISTIRSTLRRAEQLVELAMRNDYFDTTT